MMRICSLLGLALVRIRACFYCWQHTRLCPIHAHKRRWSKPVRGTLATQMRRASDSALRIACISKAEFRRRPSTTLFDLVSRRMWYTAAVDDSCSRRARCASELPSVFALPMVYVFTCVRACPFESVGHSSTPHRLLSTLASTICSKRVLTF